MIKDMWRQSTTPGKVLLIVGALGIAEVVVSLAAIWYLAVVR